MSKIHQTAIIGKNTIIGENVTIALIQLLKMMLKSTMTILSLSFIFIK